MKYRNIAQPTYNTTAIPSHAKRLIAIVGFDIRGVTNSMFETSTTEQINLVPRLLPLVEKRP
jgi:hypothetical protein